MTIARHNSGPDDAGIKLVGYVDRFHTLQASEAEQIGIMFMEKLGGRRRIAAGAQGHVGFLEPHQDFVVED